MAEETQPDTNGDETPREAPSAQPALYDEEFVQGWYSRLRRLGIALFVLIVVASVVSALNGTPEQMIAVVVTLTLLTMGLVYGLAAILMALVEFRGAARTAAELAAPEVGTKAVGEELVKAVPQIIQNFGKLKASSALALLSATLFIASAAVAWRALPAQSPAEPQGAPAGTEQPSEEPGHHNHVPDAEDHGVTATVVTPTAGTAEPTDVSPTAPAYVLRIDGHVRLESADGPGLPDVTIYRSIATYPGEVVATTDADGRYEIPPLDTMLHKEAIGVWPELAGHRFEPPEQLFSYEGYGASYTFDFIAIPEP
jgi:hypothetical protein